MFTGKDIKAPFTISQPKFETKAEQEKEAMKLNIKFITNGSREQTDQNFNSKEVKDSDCNVDNDEADELLSDPGGFEIRQRSLGDRSQTVKSIN